MAHPGAQDNAAGVAAVLQVACGLAREPAPRDVLVAFWDAEEPPTFRTRAMGSRYWHAHPTVPLDRVGAVVVLDLIGGGLWDGHATSFALGSETSPQVRAAIEATPLTRGHAVQVASLSLVEDLVIGRRMVWSDYEVFRDHQIPVLFLTDGQNKRYHTSRDRVEYLDQVKLRAEAAWLAGVTRRLATGPRLVWGPRRFPDEDRETVVELLEAALADPATEGWGMLAHEQLRSSLASLARAGAPTVETRRAAQRLMCWAGPQASRFTCGIL